MCSPVMNRRSRRSPSRSRGKSSQRTCVAEDTFMVVTSEFGSGAEDLTIAGATGTSPSGTPAGRHRSHTGEHVKTTFRVGAAVAACALLCGAAATAPKTPDHGATAGADSAGFALLELFTSEGCSSCPPADALLARLASEARRSGRRVYALSFHVDYWDRLGWKDRFSSAAFTQRQGDYARRFRLASLYTPQLVVNGAQEIVGSDAPRVEVANARSCGAGRRWSTPSRIRERP